MTRTTRTTRNRWLAGGGGVLAAAVLAVTAVTATPAQADPQPRGTTVEVDLTVAGAKPDAPGWSLGVSADGHWALFTSGASNLVSQPTTSRNVYVRDLRTGRTELANVASDGSQMGGFTADGAISANGRYVAFSSDDPRPVDGRTPVGYDNVFVHDRWTGRTELISAGTGTAASQRRFGAYSPSISADGRYVAFVSTRTDLVEGSTAPSLSKLPPGTMNIYLTDRWNGTTRLVSAGADGSPADSYSTNATISADGRTVGFSSFAGNLLPTGQPAAKAPANPNLTVPRVAPYFTYDVRSGTVRVAATDTAGAPAYVGFDAGLSPDGRFAVYSLLSADASGNNGYHRDLYVRDLRKGTVTQVSTPASGTTTSGNSVHGAVTADDRFVYFESTAGNLVPGTDTGSQRNDIYRRDLRTGRTERVAAAQDGSQGNGDSTSPFVDASGRTVVFSSTSGNLVAGPGAGPGSDFQVYARTTQPGGDGDDQGQDD